MSNAYLDPILRRAEQSPSRVFAKLHLDGEWVTATYGELLERARGFSAAYRRAGVDRGEIVFIVLQHGLDVYAAFVGAMLAGAVPSLLPYPNARHDHALYWSQHRQLFARVRPAAIVTFDELADDIRSCADGSGAVVLPQSAVEVETVADAIGGCDDDIALLQHSSGTTGLKKGVALSYRAIRDQIESYARALGRKSDDGMVVGSWLPLYHDMGLIAAFLTPLYLGAPIIALDPFVWVADPKLLPQAVEAHRITHVWLPNFAFLHLVRAVPRKMRFDLSSIAALISCSEPCKPEAFDRFLARYGDCGVKPETLQTCYAMAETVFAVSQSSAAELPRRLSVARSSIEHLGANVEGDDAGTSLLSNGPPIPGCEVRILADGQFVPEQTFGEICVRAPYLFSGYYNNPEATLAAFHDGWYRTGDLGFLDRGEVFIAGRLKDVIIVNGKNIFAHDVEACLLGVPGLKPGRAVALGAYDEKIGSELLVVIAENDGSGREASAIMSDINHAVLAETGIGCSAVRVVEPGWLVKTTSGKVSRSENLRKFQDEQLEASSA
jgi:acyl-CoA synthetase (AMP-forming)/AMP-acid ligase II